MVHTRTHVLLPLLSLRRIGPSSTTLQLNLEQLILGFSAFNPRFHLPILPRRLLEGSSHPLILTLQSLNLLFGIVSGEELLLELTNMLLCL